MLPVVTTIKYNSSKGGGDMLGGVTGALMGHRGKEGCSFLPFANPELSPYPSETGALLSAQPYCTSQAVCMYPTLSSKSF